MQRSSLAARPRVSLLASETAAQVAEEVSASGARWVWVEGFVQAGKSSFAGKLAHLLSWRSIGFDAIVHGRSMDSTRFADFIDEEKFAARLGTPESRRKVVVEGICLRDVLERFGALDESSFVVYVARVSTKGNALIWSDGQHAEQPDESMPWLLLDSIRYHRERHPYADARRILLRVGPD